MCYHGYTEQCAETAEFSIMKQTAMAHICVGPHIRTADSFTVNTDLVS